VQGNKSQNSTKALAISSIHILFIPLVEPLRQLQDQALMLLFCDARIRIYAATVMSKAMSRRFNEVVEKQRGTMPDNFKKS
jgi:hypothetical protein